MMSGMFGFIRDMGNYEERKVALTEHGHGFISTARVSDGAHDYETAVDDDRYTRDDGTKTMAIVESYDTKEKAAAGHLRWVAAITGKKLPVTLTDCGKSKVGQLFHEVRGKTQSWTLDK